MSNYQKPDSITHFSSLLPQWGRAADEIYQNFHFLNLALSQTDSLLIPQEALDKLAKLRSRLVSTLAHLIQDLPASTHRLSDENQEARERFNEHLITLKAVNLQTDILFNQLLQDYLALQDWFESTVGE